MPDQREQALQFIRNTGPVLPVQIAKALRTEILFASAILAELVSRKQVVLSHAAIGGSKLYYILGQDAQLCERLGLSLKGKEKEAHEFLREHKVVYERHLEPWQRVAFRDLKDFAVPLTVTFNNQTETFWKYRLVNDAEAKTFIEQFIEPIPETPVVQEVKAEPIQEVPVQSTPVVPEQKGIVQEELHAAMKTLREEFMKEMQPKVVQETLPLEIKPKVKAPPKEKISTPEKATGKFYETLTQYFQDHKISIIQEEVVKKDKEFNFLVKVPSAFGELPYFVKGKDKKAVNETELMQVYSEGQLRKLPTILLLNGALNKKAELLLQQKMHGQVVVKSLL